MSFKKPKRMKIDDTWYDVIEGWGEELKLKEFMGPVKYTTKQPYPVLHDYMYTVHDTNGYQVGEFRIDYRSFSGHVTDIEM